MIVQKYKLILLEIMVLNTVLLQQIVSIITNKLVLGVLGMNVLIHVQKLVNKSYTLRISNTVFQNVLLKEVKRTNILVQIKLYQSVLVLVEIVNILAVIIQHVSRNVVNKNSRMLLHKIRNVSNIVIKIKLLI